MLTVTTPARRRTATNRKRGQNAQRRGMTGLPTAPGMRGEKRSIGQAARLALSAMRFTSPRRACGWDGLKSLKSKSAPAKSPVQNMPPSLGNGNASRL